MCVQCAVGVTCRLDGPDLFVLHISMCVHRQLAATDTCDGDEPSRTVASVRTVHSHIAILSVSAY